MMSQKRKSLKLERRKDRKQIENKQNSKKIRKQRKNLQAQNQSLLLTIKALLKNKDLKEKH